MKKTLSLLLAIVMLLSVLVIPAAAAAPEDEAAPYAAYKGCPNCGSSALYSRQELEPEERTVSSCTMDRTPHVHYYWYYLDSYRCTYCGTVTRKVFRSSCCEHEL